MHNQFIDLGNLVKNVVHYLLIRMTTCLGCRDGFPMVNILVSMMDIRQDLW